MKDNTAIVTVDLTRGHFDTDNRNVHTHMGTRQYLEEEPETSVHGASLLDNVETLVTAANRAGVPVVHVTTEYRDSEEIRRNPKWRNTENRGDPEYNLEGTSGAEIMPQLRVENDYVLLPKKRYSPFIGTDIEFVLRGLDVERLVITGVNTNTCVQCTCFEATNRDYEVIVPEECVGSMDGEEFHQLGLKNIDHALGDVVSMNEVLTEFKGEAIA